MRLSMNIARAAPLVSRFLPRRAVVRVAARFNRRAGHDRVEDVAVASS